MSTDQTKNEQITITVRAPNGATKSLDVRTHDRIDKVIRDAVHDFVAERVIEAGEYDLALAREGEGIRLLDAVKRLDEYTFDAAADVFHLITKKPQVDG
jgi:hypothetical protein